LFIMFRYNFIQSLNFSGTRQGIHLELQNLQEVSIFGKELKRVWAWPSATVSIGFKCRLCPDAVPPSHDHTATHRFTALPTVSTAAQRVPRLYYLTCGLEEKALLFLELSLPPLLTTARHIAPLLSATTPFFHHRQRQAKASS
jgi:hypothetical protein